MSKKEKVLEAQAQLNQRLSKLLNIKKIRNLRMTSLGNSIATGYSFSSITKPLLLRNETLKKYLKENNIELELHKFTRCQNNSDDHIHEWFINNIKESEVNKINRLDFDIKSKLYMKTHEMTKEELDSYFPIKQKKDKRIKEVILESNEKLANIVVYNGATGSLLDNLSRKGKIVHKLNYGIKKDITSIEAILKEIQINNRNNKSNTQIYLCGAPNYLGLNITGIINTKLKKISKEYANVTYVEPIKSKFFYKNYNVENISINKIQSLLKKLPITDFHYDEIEYLKFNNNIISSIIDNYEIKESLINVDRNLYKLNNIHEKQPIKDIKEKVYETIQKEYKRIINPISRKGFIRQTKVYLLNKFPYDFFYTGKENIEESLKKTR